MIFSTGLDLKQVSRKVMYFLVKFNTFHYSFDIGNKNCEEFFPTIVKEVSGRRQSKEHTLRLYSKIDP